MNKETLLRVAGREVTPETLDMLRYQEDYLQAFFDACKRYTLNYRISCNAENHYLQVSDGNGLSVTLPMISSKWGYPKMIPSIIKMAHKIENTWEIKEEQNSNVLEFRRK